MSWWVSELVQDGAYVELLSWIFWVLLAITLHELAHGWAAIWEGDDTPIRLGHMSGNPLVHMGPMSVLLFALCGIAWGLMPVNPSRFRHGRMGEVMVAVAGPTMNLALALACVGLTYVWRMAGPAGTELATNVHGFLFTGVYLNLFLGAFNLLPIPPLDGSRILAGFSRKAREMFSHPNAPIIGLVIFGLLFFFSPVGRTLMREVAKLAFWLSARPAGVA